MEHDRTNGNDYWAMAITQTYQGVKVAFLLKEKGDKIPPTYLKITCHLIFDVKFDLRRKTRYVAGGHLTSIPSSMHIQV